MVWRNRFIWLAPLVLAQYCPSLSAFTCESLIKNEWNNGFTLAVRLHNPSSERIDGWAVSLGFPDGSTITNAWNTTLSGSQPYLANNKGYNAVIEPSATVEFGFNAAKAVQNAPAQLPTLGGDCAADASDTAPIARANASTLIGSTPLTVQLDGSQSSDANGDALTYIWQLPDGSTSNLPQTTITLTEVGTHPVTLTVNDGQQNSEPSTLNIEVTPAPADNVPCTFSVKEEWQSGYTGSITVFNDGEVDLQGWEVLMDFPEGTTLSGVWNGQLEGSGPYRVLNASYNGDVSPQGSASFGFNAQKPQEGLAPEPPVLSGICRDENAPKEPPVYQLDTANSSLYFVSTKKQHVMETHHFTELSGWITEDGQARFVVPLDKVETGIDTRNQRMRDHLFEIITHGKTAAATLSIDLEQLGDMAVGEISVNTYTVDLQLHGITTQLSAALRIHKLANQRFLVQNQQPILINAADFDLTGGIETLQNLAKLSVISTSVPVNFTLLFTAP